MIFFKLRLFLTVMELFLKAAVHLLLKPLHFLWLFLSAFRSLGAFSQYPHYYLNFSDPFCDSSSRKCWKWEERRRKGRSSRSSLLPPPSPGDIHTSLSAERRLSRLVFFQNIIRQLLIPKNTLWRILWDTQQYQIYLFWALVSFPFL